VYDGETAAAPLLGSFNGSELPQDITSSGDKLFITFLSNNTDTAPGWLLSYTSGIPVYCSGLTNMSEQTASLTDGSGPRDYHNSTTCIWMIEPPDATELTVYFTAFNTEEEFDVVMIFDLETQELLAEYSGEIVPDPVTSPSGRMFITFSTNYSVTAPGWDAYYETDLVGIDEQGSIKDFEIFPNPATNQVNLSWFSKNTGQATISISTMGGSSLVQKVFNVKTGQNHHNLDLSNMQKGIYLVSIRSAEFTGYKKLVIQ
jgi:hypothetical protein